MLDLLPPPLNLIACFSIYAKATWADRAENLMVAVTTMHVSSCCSVTPDISSTSHDIRQGHALDFLFYAVLIPVSLKLEAAVL